MKEMCRNIYFAKRSDWRYNSNDSTGQQGNKNDTVWAAEAALEEPGENSWAQISWASKLFSASAGRKKTRLHLHICN